MPIANEDIGFRARGPRNQYVPPITEENLRDNAYSTMKRGGKVGSSASLPRIKKVKKKGKATASATAIVNVYTGRRGRTAPAQPRPPKPPQPINVSVQLPNYMTSFDPRFRSNYEPLQSTRLRETYLDQPIKMMQHDIGIPYLINRGEPMKIQEAYEPYTPIEMKHEKEPDELIIMQRDLQPYIPLENVAAEAAGGEAPARRKYRSKEEIEMVRLAQEEQKQDKLYTQIRRIREEITNRQKQDPTDPHLVQLRRNLEKLTKKTIL